ncbi:LysM peptidoglycan-binding domain-containing protein [Salinicoccus cyprini]|uniref:LysM peptidoglycan-binding domain-containing protein n=1 Tax=Salinicoccus cyprini TaxID=2493691 RepID=A0A558AR13_9STAP|nr:LysM peptidoglycan-binding domain-containing protein [Salinicoccus cyprini]TVT26690.1 LysM peptidoglycan-binding domain-containing protein [Salinicoccus cyprini]
MKKIITALTATAALTTYGLADQAEASSYKVQSGDTLWKIANQNSVSVSQLKSWNNLSSDLIYINQNLKTSGSSSSSSDSSSSKSSSSSQSSSSSSSASSSAGGTYTVKSGDTLSKIARANGMNYRTLMSINNISSHIIHPGQKLSLGGNASSSSSNASEKSESKKETSETSNDSSSSSNSSSNTSTGTYSVKAGDTLSKIARAHGTTYRNIMNLNNLSSTVIHPGQKLKVSGTASTSSSSSNASSSNSSASESKETVTQNVSAPAPTNVSYGKNYYTWGECTWYVFERRQQLGKPVGNGWGNAYSWDTGAKSDGYKVNNSPSVGAIMQANAWTNYAWGMGHVAVVERINSNGSILVSEMNFGSGQGVKAFRTISASQVSSHNFIH